VVPSLLDRLREEMSDRRIIVADSEEELQDGSLCVAERLRAPALVSELEEMKAMHREPPTRYRVRLTN
jgi:hypothetical protein